MNISLLIAGRYHPNTLVNIQKNSKYFSETIVSTWREEKEIKLSNTTLIINDLPDTKDFHNVANIYYQTCSCINGLLAIDTEFVCKTRSDEFYTNLDKMINKFTEDKLLSCNVFFRNIEYCPYHISDHLFICKTKKLLAAFQNLKNYIKKKDDTYRILNDRVPAEKKITLFYLQALGYNIKDLISGQKDLNKVFRIMKKEFDIFDIAELSPYEISASVVGKIHNLDKFIKTDKILALKSIKSIDQIRYSALEKILNLIIKTIRLTREIIKL